LNDAEAEAAETQVWLDFSVQCDYITEDDYNRLYADYTAILGMLTSMINSPEKWVISKKAHINHLSSFLLFLLSSLLLPFMRIASARLIW